MVEVDADLVGPSRVQMAEDQSRQGRGVGCLYLVVGDGRLAAGWIDDCHFLTVHRVPADVSEDGVLGRFRDSLTHGKVEFLHRPARELAY